jgi:hypothetical protein
MSSQNIGGCRSRHTQDHYTDCKSSGSAAQEEDEPSRAEKHHPKEYCPEHRAALEARPI